MILLERVKLARQKFIKYYERGESNPERWRRSMFIYLTWSVQGDEYGYDVFDVIIRARLVSSSFSTIDDAMKCFDLAERFAKLWSFS